MPVDQLSVNAARRGLMMATNSNVPAMEPGVLTEPRGVVGFEVILGAYASLLSMAATESVSLVS